MTVPGRRDRAARPRHRPVPRRRDVAGGGGVRRRARPGRPRDRLLLRRRPRHPARAGRPTSTPSPGRFFALPEADRLAIENVRSPQFRGYTRFGHERTNGRVDLRDQIDIGRELPPPGARPRRPGLAAAARARTCGRPRCPSCAPSRRRGWTTSRRSASRCCGPSPLALELPADTFADAVVAARGAAQGHPLPHAAGRRAATPTATRQGVGAHRDTGLPVVRPPGRRRRAAGRARRRG